MQVTISDAIRYIGVDDKDIDLFESQYVVPEGVSYNSYVILDEKIAVMDTVDARRSLRRMMIMGMEPMSPGSLEAVD